MGSRLPPQLASTEKEVRDIFKLLSTGFNKLDQTKDEAKQTKQLEGLTAKMREAKRLIKELDREMKEEEGNLNAESNKLLNEIKQSLIKELNSFVALRKTYTSSIGNKHELLDGGSNTGSGRDMSSQEYMLPRGSRVDETVETIERTDKVMKNVTNGAETATIVNVEPEVQVSKLNRKGDSSQPSIKQMARNRCIVLLLLLIVVGVVVIIMLKVVPGPEDRVVPVSIPAPGNRRLLMTTLDFQ